MISNNIKIRIYGPEVGLKLSIGKTLRRIRPVADRIARPRSPWGRDPGIIGPGIVAATLSGIGAIGIGGVGC